MALTLQEEMVIEDLLNCMIVSIDLKLNLNQF